MAKIMTALWAAPSPHGGPGPPRPPPVAARRSCHNMGQSDRARQGQTGPLYLIQPAIQDAKFMMTLGLERTHSHYESEANGGS